MTLATPTDTRAIAASATSVQFSWAGGQQNLVPSGAQYTTNAYELVGLTPGRRYLWVKGASENKLRNGDDTAGYIDIMANLGTPVSWNNGRVYFTAYSTKVTMSGASATGDVGGAIYEIPAEAPQVDVVGDGSTVVVATDGAIQMFGTFHRFLNSILFGAVETGEGLVIEDLQVSFTDDGAVTGNNCTLDVTGPTLGTLTLDFRINEGTTTAQACWDAFVAHEDYAEMVNTYGLILRAHGPTGIGALGDYRVYRNGTLLATVTGGSAYSDSTVVALTAYGYQVQAIDDEGNQSVLSPVVGVLTPSATSDPGFPVEFGATGADSVRGVTVDGSGNVYTVGYSLIIGTLLYLSKHDDAGNLLWVRYFPVTTGGITGGVKMSPNGNVVIAGQFRGVLDLGWGPITAENNHNNLFVAIFDSSGTLLQQHTYSSGLETETTGAEFVNGLAVDSNNRVLLSGVRSASGLKPWVRCYDSTLSLVWGELFPAVADVAKCFIAVDGDDDVVLTGRYTVGPDFGGDPFPSSVLGLSCYVVKLSGVDGSHIWSHGFAGTFSVMGDAIAVDSSDDSIVVAGGIYEKIDFGGGVIGEKYSSAPKIFVLKMDTDGNHVWSKVFGSTTYQYCYSLAVGDNGEAFVAGDFYSTALTFAGVTHSRQFPKTRSGFVAKYTSAGVESSFTVVDADQVDALASSTGLITAAGARQTESKHFDAWIHQLPQ